jgi:histidine triad (HIT) family protein
VCDEVSGSHPLPGGHLQKDERVAAFHAPILAPATDVFAGYLFIAPVRHVETFSGLDQAEASALGVAIAQWCRALELAGAEHVYVLRLGHVVPHLHIHLVPRWPETPADVPWTQVDEWDGARRGDFAFATRFVQELRTLAGA